MMLIKRSLINIVTITGVILCTQTYAQVSVVKNTTLSEIAHEHFQGKVFGKNGSLSKLLELNPQIKNPDLIFPGQIIYISPKIETSSEIATSSEEPATIEEVQLIPISTTWKKRLLSITPRAFFSILKAKDKATKGTANIPSTVNAGIRLDYLQRWSDKYSSYVFLGFKKIKWETEERSIQGNKLNYTDLGLGFNFHLKNNNMVFLELAYIQDPYIRAINSTDLTLDRKARPQLLLGGKLELIQRGPFTLFGGGHLAYLGETSSSQYSIQPGHGAQIDFSLLDQFSETTFGELTSYYQMRTFDTSIANQEYRELGLKFKFGYYW